MPTTRSTLLLAAACAVLVAPQFPARAQSASDSLPHAFPRDGATRVLSNAWITAWDVTWPAGKATPMHRHQFDYFGVELVKARTIGVSVEGKVDTGSVDRGEAWFLEQGVTHGEIGFNTKTPRHAVIVDLTDSAGPLFTNTTPFKAGIDAAHAKLLTDNSRVTMWEFPVRRGIHEPLRFYDHNVVLILVDAGELTIRTGDAPPETASYPAGRLLFLPGGTARSIEAPKRDIRTIITELK